MAKPSFHIIVSVIFGLFLHFTTGCFSPKAPYAYSPTLDVQGHRGARGLMPENTVKGFLEALRWGVQTIEMDVVVTKDSQLVLSHEPWMSDVICATPTGGNIGTNNERKHNIFNMTLREVQEYDCGTKLHPRFSEQKHFRASKPTLREVTDSVSNYLMRNNLDRIYFNIETKSAPDKDGIFNPEPTTFARLLYTELEALGILSYTTIQSFDPRTLEAVHHLDSTISVALLIENTPNEHNFEKNLKLLTFTPTIYSCNWECVQQNWVEIAHQRGIKVIPWTVNEVADMKKLIEMGVDGIITDYPNRTKELIK